MTCRHKAVDLLPFYAAESLGEEERLLVAEHLAVCAECRAELALWSEVGAAAIIADAELPAAPASVLEGALAQARAENPGLLVRAWQLLRAQVPLVRGEIWSASALVIALGLVVSLGGGADRRTLGFLGAIAPLVAAAGVAMIYGPENDPALELALATPTSPRQVLLARLALVFGWNLALSLAASLGLVLAVPVGLLGALIMEWLGPMTFLSALALTLSLRVGTSGAVATVCTLWLARWLGRGMEISVAGQAETARQLLELGVLYQNVWSNSALLLSLAALLVAASLWLAGRREPFLAGHGQLI
ncbi:MAG: zf-HC2 domain-containing protein [Chloroflexota bacterium]